MHGIFHPGSPFWLKSKERIRWFLPTCHHANSPNRKTSRVRTTASYCFIMTSCRLFSLFQHSIAFISIEGNPKIGGFSCTSVLLESDSGWTRQRSSNTKTGGQRLRVSSEKMPLSVQRLFTFLTCHGALQRLQCNNNKTDNNLWQW